MAAQFMNLPTYLETGDEASYHEYLNQSLRDGLSEKGWTVPQITDENLRTTPVQNPQNGAITTLAEMMPDGTLWFVISESAPVYVGKINGSLVKFTTTAYP